jgi:hypothetical protein
MCKFKTDIFVVYLYNFMLILEKLNLSFFRLMNYNLQSTIEFPILP